MAWRQVVAKLSGIAGSIALVTYSTQDSMLDWLKSFKASLKQSVIPVDDRIIYLADSPTLLAQLWRKDDIATLKALLASLCCTGATNAVSRVIASAPSPDALSSVIHEDELAIFTSLRLSSTDIKKVSSLLYMSLSDSSKPSITDALLLKPSHDDLPSEWDLWLNLVCKTPPGSAEDVAEAVVSRAEYQPEAVAKAVKHLMTTNTNLTLTASQVSRLWQHIPPRLRRRSLSIQAKRYGPIPDHVYADAVTEAVEGKCGLIFALPLPPPSAVQGVLVAAALAAEAALGVTDKTRSSPLVEYFKNLQPWQYHEGLDPFPPQHVLPAPPPMEPLRRLELLSDLLITAPTAFRVSRVFGRCVLPLLTGRPAADVAALGTHANGLILKGSGAEGARLRFNLIHARLPTAPRLRDGLLPMGDRIDAETVFVCVHGLQGGADTWVYADEDNSWPAEILEEKFPGSKVLSFYFDAPLWGYQQSETPYHEVSSPTVIASIADRLASVVQSARPRSVCFITHSMGGLVVKRALLSSAELRAATRGVVFFATPHLGSSIANYATTTLVPQFVAELSPRDPQLTKLNDDYLALNLPTLNIFETAAQDLSPGWRVVVVPRASAVAAGGRAVAAGEVVNHSDITKLTRDTTDPRRVALLDFFSLLIPQLR